MKHPEKDLQKACIKWAGYSEVRYPKLKNMFHVPNQGMRNARYRHDLKEMGLKSGVPDLLIPALTKNHVGLAIELKSDKGNLSDNQECVLQMLKEEGWSVAVVKSVDGFIKVIEEYFK